MHPPEFLQAPGSPWLLLPLRLAPWLGLALVVAALLLLPLPAWLAGLLGALVVLPGGALLWGFQRAQRRVKICPACLTMLRRTDSQCHRCGFRETDACLEDTGSD